MSEHNQLTVWQSMPNAREANAKALGITSAVIRKNGSIETLKAFAASQSIVIDKKASGYNRDKARDCRNQFNALRVEYWSRNKPVAREIIEAEGFHVRSLQPRYNKKGEFVGANIMVRREPKTAGLTIKAENALLKKQLAEAQAKLMLLPA